jgi:hypothetical protein
LSSPPKRFKWRDRSRRRSRDVRRENAHSAGDVATLPDDLRDALAEQRGIYGAPLHPYLFYARNPAYFRAAQAMWAALQQETKRVPVRCAAAQPSRRVLEWLPLHDKT